MIFTINKLTFVNDTKIPDTFLILPFQFYSQSVVQALQERESQNSNAAPQTGQPQSPRRIIITRRCNQPGITRQPAGATTPVGPNRTAILRSRAQCRGSDAWKAYWMTRSCIFIIGVIIVAVGGGIGAAHHHSSSHSDSYSGYSGSYGKNIVSLLHSSALWFVGTLHSTLSAQRIDPIWLYF